jgi:hypothetical protein
MTTATLVRLKAETAGRIRDLDRLMASTPRDTVAYQAMVESRPGLLAFRQSVDDELDRRGA